MTETTARIRWVKTSLGEFAGRVGTLRWLAFQMRPPVYDGGAWQLTSYIPGSVGKCTYYDEQEEAQAEAERWLEEFTSSLGAAFPGPAFEFEEDDEPLEVRYAPGAYVRYAHPDAGWPGDQDEARELLTHGRLYRVAWNDIGQSRTRIGLVGVKGVGFNSVLFEPVADEDVTDAEAAEVARRDGIGQTSAPEAGKEKEQVMKIKCPRKIECPECRGKGCAECDGLGDYEVYAGDAEEAAPAAAGTETTADVATT